ncbi:hypothetical protein Ocin01_08839 [Orchesella cincta]|uniref:Globin domain-containing protein n=1 Tax=Orchesella cincta TaxID=48709 RepID=A0A1D2MY32_ORCCI|nr:hypothetical protein Ocin01_08839 [Orchesella cincta]
MSATPNVLGSSVSDDNPTSPSPPKTQNLEPPQPQLQDSKLIMNLNFILEPWDWRKDCCLAQPLIYTSIQDHWIVHVRLPAGRNIFRLWLVPQSNPPEQDPANDSKRKFAVPFSVRVVSQTPIYIGSRIEVQNYMTNPPMLFLKQCERLANNIWGLFACFGKQRNEYHKNLKQLRRTYCPAYPEPDTINKFTKATHDTFEQLFVSLITFLNGGTLDRMLILALRVIFLNPMIGRQFMPKVEENSLEAKVFEGVLKTLGRKAKTMVYSAVITIQKFYRGWRVRRLFRLRDKYDPKFKKIEYCVRRIGFLLARESDSIYSHEEPNDKKVESSRSANKPPNIFPTPPHWAVDMLRYLIEQNPWLITMHPHAYCVPHHIQLQEMEGEVPPDMKNFSWFPFLRETLRVPPNAKSCFCEIDLQAYPYTGISMKIINNDTGKLLTLRNNSLFLGHIANNKRGYTVFCYRWTVPNAYQDANERFPSKLWKLRVVSPYTESVPRFVADADDEEGTETPKRNSDAPVRTWRTSKESQHSNISDKENAEENDNENDNVDNTDVENVENEFPHKLCLRRLEGYYMPSKDASVCRYILETEEKKCTISLRFRASHAKARVRVQVWDCSKKSLIFEETCDGGLLVPCIQLHVTKKSGCTLNLAYDSSESLREDWSRGDLVSCSGLLTLEKKSSSAENEDENEEEEEEEQKMEEETEQQKEEETLDIPDPDPGNGGNLKRRYVISVYVVDDSWQLTDNEWLFVLDKKREFFRDLTRWYSRNCEVRRRGTEKNGGDDPLGFDEEAGQHVNVMDPSNTQDLEATNTEIIGPTSQPSESTDKPKEKEKPDFISNKRKKTRAEKSLKEKVEKDKEREKIEKEKNEKMDGGDSKDAAQLSDHTHYTVLPDHQPAAPPPTAAYPLINTTSSAATVPVSPVEQLDDKEGKIRRRGSGNLLIKYGGRQSQDIKQLDKPYWILEVLLDANVKYKMKSNRHQFRKKFLRAQESWTKECTAAQEPPAGAANTVDELANANNNAEMANIYECVCPEDEDYNGFANQGVMNPSCCYKKVETQPKKTAGSNSEEGDEEEHQDPAPQEHGEAVMDLGFERRQTADMADMKSEKPGKDKKKLLASKSKYVEGAAASKKKIPEQSEKPGGNRKKKGAHSIYKDDDIDKEPSAPITTQPEEVPPPPPPPETVEEEPKPEIPEPEDPLTEQETVRLKRCGVVGEILKCYAELFMQTIPVREELLEMVKKNQLETKGPKKLVLTKTGVGKYCQKLFHMENKTKTREAIVAEKLLKWAFEYFCLEPTEENCEPNEDDTGDKVTLFLH